MCRRQSHLLPRIEAESDVEFEKNERDRRNKTSVVRNASATLTYLVRVRRFTTSDRQTTSLRSHSSNTHKHAHSCIMSSSVDNTIDITTNCDHYVCDVDDVDFEDIITKIDHFDAAFYPTEHEALLVEHYREFLSYWMSLVNSRYVNNELFHIYVAQAAYRLLKNDSGRFHNAHIRLNYAILIKTIYERKISDESDTSTIQYILSHFESDSSMVNFLQTHVPCNCLDHFYGGSPDDYYPPFLDYLNYP